MYERFRLGLNDFTKPLGMSVALDDNIPRP